jgi:hypothetical protein
MFCFLFRIKRHAHLFAILESTFFVYCRRRGELIPPAGEEKA